MALFEVFIFLFLIVFSYQDLNDDFTYEAKDNINSDNKNNKDKNERLMDE